MQIRESDPTEEPLFPSKLTFVVQFTREGTERHGYVEHIATGRSARFADAGELLAFMDSIIEAPSPADVGLDNTPH